MDARVAELRRENEELRLRLFWKDYRVSKLQKAMQMANCWENSPNCNCWQCAVTGRMDCDTLVDESRKCGFISWFEAKVAACDLIVGYVLRDSTQSQHVSNPLNGVWDTDCHIVKIVMFGGDWSLFTYGSRLWKAKTVNDPELEKLKKLFELLSCDDSE